MPYYKIRWTETHEAVFQGRDEEEALDAWESDSECITRVNMNVEDVEYDSPDEPDCMDFAKEE